MAPPDISAQLAALNRDYAARLPERVAALRASATALNMRWDDAAALELRRLLHNLAGSGASYGLPAVSGHARSAEHALVALIEAQVSRSSASFRPLFDALDGLRAAATPAP